MIKKRTKNCRTVCPHPKSVNLYRFVRLILGPDISNRQIALRWGIHEKNFHEFSTGRYPVPRLEQLEKLAQALGVHPVRSEHSQRSNLSSKSNYSLLDTSNGVNKHLVYEVAGGASADKVWRLVKKNDLKGLVKLLFP